MTMIYLLGKKTKTEENDINKFCEITGIMKHSFSGVCINYKLLGELCCMISVKTSFI